jgi:predicted O-methyltransferase YrrM
VARLRRQRLHQPRQPRRRLLPPHLSRRVRCRPITAILEEIKRGDTNQLAVSPEDGQFLRMLVASTGRKRALEIGAARATARSGSGWACATPAGRL